MRDGHPASDGHGAGRLLPCTERMARGENEAARGSLGLRGDRQGHRDPRDKRGTAEGLGDPREKKRGQTEAPTSLTGLGGTEQELGPEQELGSPFPGGLRSPRARSIPAGTRPLCHPPPPLSRRAAPGPAGTGQLRGLRSPFVPFLRPFCPQPPAAVRSSTAGTDLCQTRSGLRDPMDAPIPMDTPILPDTVRTAWDLHLKGKGTSSRLCRTPAARRIPGPAPGISPGIGIPQGRESGPGSRVFSCRPPHPGPGLYPESPPVSPQCRDRRICSCWKEPGRASSPGAGTGLNKSRPPSLPPFQAERGCSCKSQQDFKSILDILEPMGAQGSSREGLGVDTPGAGGSWWLQQRGEGQPR